MGQGLARLSGALNPCRAGGDLNESSVRDIPDPKRVVSRLLDDREDHVIVPRDCWFARILLACEGGLWKADGFDD